MTKRDVAKKIRAARTAVLAEIAANANRGGLYARGLAGEGYAGGYSDALDDVMLLLVSNTVPERRGYWIGEAAK